MTESANYAVTTSSHPHTTLLFYPGSEQSRLLSRTKKALLLHFIRIKSLPNKSTQPTQDSTLPRSSLAIFYCALCIIALIRYATTTVLYLSIRLLLVSSVK